MKKELKKTKLENFLVSSIGIILIGILGYAFYQIFLR